MASTNYKLVAVGGGPAGIAAAVEAIEMGMKSEEVLVLEKGPNLIEAIRRFYPEKKMTVANYKGLPTVTYGHIPVFPDLTKAETITYFDDLVAKYKIEVRLNSEVFKAKKRPDGKFEVLVGHNTLDADAVTIGIGILGRPNKPTYKVPNSLRTTVLYDLTTTKIANCNVLVVGGGDTSAEYADILQQEGCKVTLAYRGDKFHRMMDQNRTTLERLGSEKKVEIRLNCEIAEVLDEAGKPRVKYLAADRFAEEVYDHVIYAIGGTTPINFLKTLGVNCNENWPIYGTYGETNIPGLYLTGDLVSGKTGGSIVTAYNSAYRSVSHLLGQTEKIPPEALVQPKSPMA